MFKGFSQSGDATHATEDERMATLADGDAQAAARGVTAGKGLVMLVCLGIE